MMRLITEYDLEMSGKLTEWLDWDRDGNCSLNPNTPKDVRDYWIYLQKEYDKIPDSWL